MQVTFLNASLSPVYIGSLYISLGAGLSVTTRRTAADLDRDYGLKVLVAAGTVTLTFAKEAADDVALGSQDSLVSYSNATRPLPSTIPIFSAIWNTNDNATNWSDGTNWRDATGVIT